MPETKQYNDHTPLPWREYHNTYHDVWAVDGEGDTLCELYYLDEETHRRIPLQEGHESANAEFIVHACNTYYETQAEISRLREQVEERITVEQAMDVVKEWCEKDGVPNFDEPSSVSKAWKFDALRARLSKLTQP